jgi:type IV pilus assembly protein PilW
VVTFSVNNNNQLVMSNLLGAANQVLVDGVVGLQAQYGIGTDTDGDGLADQLTAWQVTVPAGPPVNPNPLGLIIAVRFAVLTQSGQLEKPDPTTGLCNATTLASPELTWAGGQFDVTNIPNWQCYRYKKFEAVVPLRNVLWTPNA